MTRELTRKLTGVSRRMAFLGLVVTLATMAVVAAAGAAGAADTQEKTYIEFIIDASGSMRERVEGTMSRMDVAKEVMTELLLNLEDRPDLEIALRVYGFMLPGKSSCQDSGLMQPFGPVGKVRPAILEIVKSLAPKGMTPISYSLEEATRDFPAGKGGRNVIVLITDGEESCGANPCKVAADLEARGLILKPYVVGFGLSEQAEAKVKCIGNYFPARDKKSLVDALQSILVEVVAPPSLEIEAWGDRANVTARTAIEVLDSSGKPIKFERKGGEQLLRLTLEEGVYTIKGTLTIENESLVASQSGVTLKKGETTRVRLDFGSLSGRVVVVARASGKDVSDQVNIAVERAGSKVAATWAGAPPATTLAAATYDFVVALKDHPSMTQRVKSWIPPNKETRLEVDFGELPGRLVLSAQAGGRPILPSKLRAGAYVGGKSIREFGADGDRMVAVVPPGIYNIQCLYSSDPEQTRTVENVEVKGGETKDIPVTFGLPGRLRVKVFVNDAPSDKIDVRLHRGKEPMRSLARVESERGIFEAGVLEGSYDILAVPSISGYGEKWLKDVQIKAGETVEKEIRLTATMIRVKLTSEGKPYSLADTRVMLYEHDPDKRDVSAQEYVRDLDKVSKGIFELKVKEGLYDLEIIHLGEGYPDKTLRKLEVKAGEALEKSLEVGGSGVLRVKLTSEGKPYSLADTRLMLYQHDPDQRDVSAQEYVRDLDKVSKGIFELKVKEGLYDLEIIHLGEGYPDKIVRKLDVTAGETLEKSLELGGSGVLRLKVTWNGMRCTEDDIRLMLYAHDPDERDPAAQEYICDPEQTSAGVFQAKLREGIYDLCITDGFSEQWIRGLEIVSGGTLEKEIEVALEEQ